MKNKLASNTLTMENKHLHVDFGPDISRIYSFVEQVNVKCILADHATIVL